MSINIGGVNMRKLKKMEVMLLLGISAFSLFGCNGMKNTPDEEKILDDLQTLFPSQTLENAFEIEIQRSQLQETEKTWTADISIYAEDEYAEMTAETTLVYNYYDDRGWMLEAENTSYPVFGVDNMIQGMTEEDMSNILSNNDMEYVDDIYNSDTGIHQISYKKIDDNYRLFETNISGVLDCTYVDTDNGWQISNNLEEPREIVIRTENVLAGVFCRDYDGDYSDGTFTVEEISEDGKNITFSFTAPSKIGGKVEAGKIYHAELEKVESDDEYKYFYAYYNIIDTDTGEDQRLQLADFYNDNSGQEEGSFSIWGTGLGGAIYFYLQ